jgi:phosphoribosylanthranilate isomerase
VRRTRVKVCCISTVEEARTAVAAGVDAMGFVSAMPSGPGMVSEDAIRAMARTVPPLIATFLLTSHQRAPDIVAQQRRCGTNGVQLCDRLKEGTHTDLRNAMPGISIIQVIHVSGPESITEAAKIAPDVDALLLDSGILGLSAKQLGGTGRTHDWELSSAIRNSVPVPVFLAGGLHGGNVRKAIDQVQPWGVDLCSGVRTRGHLDPAKLREFMLACTQGAPDSA